MANLVGQQLGNYRLTRLLGQGGFADVYLGEHTQLNMLAAIKVLRTQLTGEDVENFRNEARTVAQLKHPNIVRVMDFNVEGNTPFLVMEYALNGTLRQRHPRGTPLPVETIIPYVKQMASALQYAHERKFIHRDVKPENMLLGSDNEVLLSDFGIAVMTPSARPAGIQGQKQPGWDPTGTVMYMAPEQIQGRTVAASDLYSLAVVVFEWLTGTLPFSGSYIEVVTQQVNAPPPSLREREPGLSPTVEQVVITALTKDPRQRFGSVQAFANALTQATKPKVSPVVSSQSPLPEGSAMETIQAVLASAKGKIPVGATRFTIGRAPDNQLVLNKDPKVSSHHAELHSEGQYHTIVDLGSTNHTFVNDQELYRNTPQMLHNGDVIRIGDMHLIYEVTNALQNQSFVSDGSTIRAEAGPLGVGPVGPVGPVGGVVGNAEQFGTSYGGEASDAAETYLTPRSSYAPPAPQQGFIAPQIPPAGYPSMPPHSQQSQQSPSYNPMAYPAQSQMPQQANLQSQYGGGVGNGGNIANIPGASSRPNFPITPNAPGVPNIPAAQPQFSPQQNRRNLNLGLIVLAVLAMLIIVGSSLFFISHNNQVATNNASATSTAHAQTQVVQRTATAHAGATTTAVARATATFIAQYPNPYPPRTGKIAFFDTLTDASTVTANGWDDNATTCQFRNGGYNATETSQHALVVCNAHNTNFANFAYRVVMTIVNGDCGGLAFRSDKQNQNFYMYEVCADGTFSLLTYSAAAGGGASGTYLINHQSNAAINKGTGSAQSNLIAVVANGSTIDLYANNVLLGSQNDPKYTSGEIGLGADNYTATSTDALYNDARLWNLNL